MSITPKDILGRFSGGRVLDVATGSGGFVHFLSEGLKDYSEIVGLDASPRAAQAFAQAFNNQPRIRFESGDACQMAFAPASFDMVCISNSLHHFDDPQVVLREMLRVLKPGGKILISEMVSDGQSEAQLTHVYLHHWWAAIDTTNGIVHHETYQRDQLLELVSGLELEDLASFDLSSTTEDAKDPELLEEIGQVIDQYIQRASGHPDLQRRGEELRRRVSEIGFHAATTLIILAGKPAFG
jgi:ubiquinone/menaquinone biosynthesis C-methylase UbiE